MTFTGRSRRLELLYYWLAATLLSTVLDSLFFPVEVTDDGEFTRHWLSQGLGVVLLIPFPALVVRRLHDQDRTGWWAMCYLGIAIGGIILSEMDWATQGQPLWLVLLLLVISLVLLFTLFRQGTTGANRYGDDPRMAEAE